MGTTAHGIVYPDPSDTPRRLNLQTLATSTEDAIAAIGDVQSYTPALSNWTLGNGTRTGAWARLGDDLIWWRIALTIGSGSTAGTLSFSPPPTPPVTSTGFQGIGDFALFDLSVGGAAGRRFWQAAVFPNGGTIAPFDPAGAQVAAAVPWTWAAGDVLVGQGTYRAS